MSEETRWAPYGEEPPWQWLAGPPPELLESDIVPVGADPICRVCILPHHPLASVCPHCGEIVSRWATIMEPPWIFVWGLGLWRILAQARLSRLLSVGLVIIGVDYLSRAASMWMGAVDAIRHSRTDWYLDWYVLSMPLALVCLVVALRAWEAAARAWGSWRLTEDEGATPTQPL